MDEQVFASLAQISLLIVPVGTIEQSTFAKWSAEIHKFDEIRLCDIPSGSKDESGTFMAYFSTVLLNRVHSHHIVRFMPSPLATGFLNLSYVSRPPPLSRSSLGLFRPSGFPLGVVGIASCSQGSELRAVQDQFQAMLANMFSTGSLYPLARSCFVFEDGGDGSSLDIGKSLPQLFIIPSMMGNKQIYIGTLLAEICSTILGGFSTIVRLSAPYF